MEVDEERFRLEQEAEDLINEDPENERLHQVYERLDDLDADKAEAKAARILKGLGFNKGLSIVILGNDYSRGPLTGLTRTGPMLLKNKIIDNLKIHVKPRDQLSRTHEIYLKKYT